MQPDYTYKAHITAIVDGDTVDAIVDVGFRLTAKLRLRLLGINTPELHSADAGIRKLAQDAKVAVAVALLDKDVIIKTQKSDAFGRYLASIFVLQADGSWLDFNADLLVRGLAVPFK